MYYSCCNGNPIEGSLGQFKALTILSFPENLSKCMTQILNAKMTEIVKNASLCDFN